jgi:hypothetical protein
MSAGKNLVTFENYRAKSLILNEASMQSIFPEVLSPLSNSKASLVRCLTLICKEL